MLLAIARRRPNAVILEPEDGRYVVRCELDGDLWTIASMDSGLGDAVAARLVLLAGLDLVDPSEQLGRLRFRAPHEDGRGGDIASSTPRS